MFCACCAKMLYRIQKKSKAVNVYGSDSGYRKISVECRRLFQRERVIGWKPV